MSVSASQSSESLNPCCYSRKDKSLGVLCSNFLKLYDRDDVKFIGLDDAAAKLGVERRRIYDIVNILEIVGIMSRKAKNQYSWKGFSEIPRTLDKLMEEALNEGFLQTTSFNTGGSQVSVESYAMGPMNDKPPLIDKPPSSNGKVERRRDKSLGILTQNFVKLFLCSNEELISLDDAAMALLGDIHDPNATRNNSAAKVRRLYDIGNVFVSINLIEKIQHPESRRPAFRWLGVEGCKTCRSRLPSAPNSNNYRKRAFGTDITNSEKKYKGEGAEGYTGVDMTNSESRKESNHRKFVFGPFQPMNVESSSIKKRVAVDLEKMSSSHLSQYCNKALSETFDHYVLARKSWCFEVGVTERNSSKNMSSP